MKTNSTKLAATLAVIVAFSTSVCAQGDGESGAGGLVTVLDVAAVFDKYPSFNDKMTAIKEEADQLKSVITAKQEQIRQDALELQSMQVGSPERNQLEASLEQQQTSLRTDARQAEQDLLNREAVIYYETYQTLQEEVAKAAAEHKIALVLRYDSAPIDQNNRPDVIKCVNRTVVFHHKLDLTKLIIERMNARSANAGAAPMK